MSGPQKFAIRYGSLKRMMTVMGMGPRSSGASVDGDTLEVRMGWTFRATIPRSSVTSAGLHSGPVGGIGVHGWRGHWLVNGTTSGMVQITIDPVVRAHMMGVPVHLSRLRLSLEEPERFVEALGAGPG